MIGIDDYPGAAKDLRAAVADTTQIRELLDRIGSPPDQRRILLDAQAGAADVLDALDWLVDHAGPTSTAIVFYAGHARSTNAKESLVAADGTLIPDSMIAARLAPLAAKRTWIVLSACYGGGFTELLAPGRILTAAAPADQLAYERSDYTYSYLVEYLIRRALIDGSAPATVHAGFAWAHRELARVHPGREPIQFEDNAPDFTLEGLTPTTSGTSAPSEPPPRHGGEPQTAPPPPNQCRALTLGTVHCQS